MLLDLAERLDRLPRAPRHPPRRVHHHARARSPTDVPLQWAAKGVVVVQYDKDDVEALGLVKMDILGLRMHSAISEAVRPASRRAPGERDPSRSSCRRRPEGLRDHLARPTPSGCSSSRAPGSATSPRACGSATSRTSSPRSRCSGPVRCEAEMIRPFIRRRHGLEPVVVPHPAMGRVLGRHLRRHRLPGAGARRWPQAVAGFDLAEADILRRAMTKDRAGRRWTTIGAALRGARRRAAESRSDGRGGLPPAPGLRRLRLQQGARGVLRGGLLRHRRGSRRTTPPSSCGILNNEPMGFYIAARRAQRRAALRARGAAAGHQPVGRGGSRWRMRCRPTCGASPAWRRA